MTYTGYRTDDEIWIILLCWAKTKLEVYKVRDSHIQGKSGYDNICCIRPTIKFSLTKYPKEMFYIITCFFNPWWRLNHHFSRYKKITQAISVLFLITPISKEHCQFGLNVFYQWIHWYKSLYLLAATPSSELEYLSTTEAAIDSYY